MPMRCSPPAASRPSASRSICRTTACSTRSACSRRDRCPAPSTSAACGSVCRSARTPGPTGATTRTWSRPWPKAVAKSSSCRTARPTGATRATSASMSLSPASPKSGLPLVYVNQVGGQDELVFDGASFALNADRSIAFQLPAFRETVVTTQWSRTGGTWRCTQGPITPAEDRRAGRLHRLHAWAARLRRQEPLQGRRARPLRRRRFGIVRGAGDGRARRRPGALRDAAVPLHVARDSRDDAAAIAKTLGVHYDDRADRERGGGARSGAGRRLCRRAARRHRGESAGARPRHHPDGDLQQVRRRWW